MNAHPTKHTESHPRPSWTQVLQQQDGVSLVSTMLALSLLAVFAMVAASLAVNERRTAFNDLSHAQSFVAADSGGEAAIAWLMMTNRPPLITDMGTGKVRAQGMTTMTSSSYQDYAFDVRMRPNPVPDPNKPFMTKARPGYDANRYLDFFYDVDATGAAGPDGRSNVSVIVTKLTQLNYN
jgi:hypothetical protein